MESGIPPPLPVWARSGPNEPAPTAGPWEFWPTIGFSACIAIAYVIAQSVGVVAWILIARLPLSAISDAKELTQNGGVVAYATLISTVVTIGLCLSFARIREGISLREYFALHWPSKRVALRWFAGFLLYLLLCGLVFSFLDSSATEEFARAIQNVSGLTRVLLWIALYIGAPVTEEFYFRGFLFVGIQRSRLGPIGAIALTTLLFAAIHVQYGLQGLIMVSAASVFFGVARHKTNSLPLCIMLHSIMNVIATVGQAGS
jgi:membrane protease YdiL (CAAX protease family)